MTAELMAAKAARLADQLSRALRDADVEVIGHTGGTLVDDHRGGTFATANVTLSAAGTEALVEKLIGEPVGDRDLAIAARSALHAKRLAGDISKDAETGNIGIANVTEGVVQGLIAALHR